MTWCLRVLLCCYSLLVLIMSYFLHSNRKCTLIKDLDVQAIKMCRWSCIIIQPYDPQSSPPSLDVLCSHHWWHHVITQTRQASVIQWPNLWLLQWWHDEWQQLRGSIFGQPQFRKQPLLNHDRREKHTTHTKSSSMQNIHTEKLFLCFSSSNIKYVCILFMSVGEANKFRDMHFTWVFLFNATLYI